MEEICEAIKAGTLSNLLQTKPHILRQSDSFGDLPLHAACSFRYEFMQTAAIETLAKAYPEALGTPDSSGMLPLHLACWFKESRLVRTLIEMHPAGLTTADENGYLPVGFLIGKMAMSNEGWEEMRELFEYLLTQAPETLWKVDNQGVLPLQHANWNEGVGEQLLAMYIHITASEGGMKRPVNADLQTPIHVALCSTTLRLDIIEQVHQADPDAILVPDCQGNFPLQRFLSKELIHHHMTSNKTKLDWLVRTDPQAPARVNTQNGKTALHCVLENPSLFYRKDPPSLDLDAETSPFLSMLRLVTRDTSNQKERNEWLEFATSNIASGATCALFDHLGNLPLHLAVTRHSHNPELVAGLLQQYPGGILAQNSKGQTALDIARTNPEDVDGSQNGSLTTLFTLVNFNPFPVLQEYANQMASS